jgi:membrane protein implicated in regulation of membrane protease activity
MSDPQESMERRYSGHRDHPQPGGTMFAVLAVIAFAIALILHLAGVARLVLDAELIGFICLSVHLVWGVYPWRRTP